MHLKSAEELLFFLMDELRNFPYGFHESLSLSLKIMAWAKLSKLKKVPQHLNLLNSQIQNLQDLVPVFIKLADLDELGIYRKVFQNSFDPKLGVNLSINILLFTVGEAINNGILDNCQLSAYSFLSSDSRVEAELSIPNEVIFLMIGLAGNLSKKTIYCPYDQTYAFSSQLKDINVKVYVENTLPNSSMFLALCLINELDIEVKFGNLLIQPNYIDIVQKQLRKFDISFSFPPMNVEVATDIVKKDIFNRFVEQTKSGNILHIRHILSQTKEKSIIACSRKNLFSMGAEQSMREDLLKSGVLKAVINMPSALLPFTGIPFSILVFDRTEKHEIVRFFAGDDERFFVRDGRSRAILKNWEELLNLFEDCQDEAICVDVNVEDILKNNADLSPSRYLLPPKIKAVNYILSNSNIRLLEDCVEFVRPLVRKKTNNDNTKKDCFLVHEVGIGDLPEFGYLKEPPKVTYIPKKEISEKDFELFIQPNDIVIAMKASAGKVAIAPDTVPLAGDGGWMVNQSCLILRSRSEIDPRVLFMYLRSDLGQILLNSLVSGATVSLIQLRSLKNLQVIMPTAVEKQNILKTFDEQVKRQAQIEELQLLQMETNQKHWSIPD